MKKIGMVVKSANPEAVKLGCEIASWVAGRGGRVFALKSQADRLEPAVGLDAEELAEAVEVMVALGGDGTMLYAARVLDGRKVPIFGVNLGGLGFLTTVTVDDFRVPLEKALQGECTVEERMLLSVELERAGEVVSRHSVLNDVVIKGSSARLVRMETQINKEYVTTYRADGLIVATPTGSTAYSLSAAGPILYPTIHSIIVAPICPFNLTNRPVVIPDWMTVDVTVCPDQERIGLILDGQVDVDIRCGDVIKIKRAEKSAYIAKYEGKSYFDILRERLMWEVKVDRPIR